MADHEHSTGTIVRFGGGLTAAFSLATGLFVLFVIPANAYVTGGLVIIFGFTFILGALAFLVGKVFLR
ncbi:MAG: hypothetical protein AB1603_03315 [Chloroflexota bacterium]